MPATIDMQEFFAAKLYEKEKSLTPQKKAARRYGVMKSIERADAQYADWVSTRRITTRTPMTVAA
jgi:hypothetical protein